MTVKQEQVEMVPGSGVVLISRHSPAEVALSTPVLAIVYYCGMVKTKLTRSVAVRHAIPVAWLELARGQSLETRVPCEEVLEKDAIRRAHIIAGVDRLGERRHISLLGLISRHGDRPVLGEPETSVSLGVRAGGQRKHDNGCGAGRDSFNRRPCGGAHSWKASRCMGE